MRRQKSSLKKKKTEAFSFQCFKKCGRIWTNCGKILFFWLIGEGVTWKNSENSRPSVQIKKFPRSMINPNKFKEIMQKVLPIIMYAKKMRQKLSKVKIWPKF